MPAIDQTARHLRDDDPELWRRIRVAAASDSITVRELLRRCLDEYLERHYPGAARP